MILIIYLKCTDQMLKEYQYSHHSHIAKSNLNHLNYISFLIKFFQFISIIVFLSQLVNYTSIKMDSILYQDKTLLYFLKYLK